MSDSDQGRWSNGSLCFLSLKNRKKKKKVRSLNGLKLILWHSPSSFWDLQKISVFCSTFVYSTGILRLHNPMRVQALVCGTRQSLPAVKTERQEWAWTSLSRSQPQRAPKLCHCHTHHFYPQDSVLPCCPRGALCTTQWGRGIWTTYRWGGGWATTLFRALCTLVSKGEGFI